MSNESKMKGYKAFDKGMICRGKQYAENTVFEEENAEVCKSGMHFCKEPLEVLNYYPLVNENGEMSELRAYNEEHGTRLSYGQYIAKIESGEIAI